MTADEYDTGEEPSPTNRTRSGEPFVVGGDEADRAAPADASSEGFDADRIRGTADGRSFVARGVAVFSRAARRPRRLVRGGSTASPPARMVRGATLRATRVFRDAVRLAFTVQRVRTFGTADETPYFSHFEAMCHD